MITDDDFVVPRIIEKVFLQDRIEDMLIYLNEKRQKKTSNFND